MDSPLSVSSSDRTSLQQRPRFGSLHPLESFSILLGSNLASTLSRLCAAIRSCHFQYPPRIEPRFNSSRVKRDRDRRSDFQYPPRIEPRFNQHRIQDNALDPIFQYPPRIEPRFNEGTIAITIHVIALSVSSSDRTSLQHRPPEPGLPACPAFSILLGSNLASTAPGSTTQMIKAPFQYPPRIEPRFNASITRNYRTHLLTFSILLGSNLASTFAIKYSPNSPCIFQYPPRIEPRFNFRRCYP